MPQIDLIAYSEIISFLYVIFWLYFSQVVLITTKLFQWISYPFLRKYLVLKKINQWFTLFKSKKKC